jgi:hypothetical protein
MDKRGWVCPVCDKFLPYDTLFEDPFYDSILQATTEQDNEIEMNADATWHRPSKPQTEEDYIDLTGDDVEDLTCIPIKQEDSTNNYLSMGPDENDNNASFYKQEPIIHRLYLDLNQSSLDEEGIDLNVPFFE